MGMFNENYASAMAGTEHYAVSAAAYSKKCINGCAANRYYAIDNAKRSLLEYWPIKIHSLIIQTCSAGSVDLPGRPIE